MSFLCKNNVFLRKLNKSLVEIKVRERYRRTFAEMETLTQVIFKIETIVGCIVIQTVK